jgi:hypothetical protein
MTSIPRQIAAGPGRHRRRGPLSLVGAWVLSGVLLIATVAAGRSIIAFTSDIDAHMRPFVRTGSVGETVDARTFSVRVLAVRGAATIDRRNQYYDTGDEEEEEGHDSGGVFVLVRVRAVAYTEPTTINYATVVDSRGRTFTPTERISQPLVGGRPLQPGIAVEGEIVFEVPRDVATVLAVRIGEPLFDERLAAVAEVPLPITQGSVEAWLAEDTPAIVGEAVVVR